MRFNPDFTVLSAENPPETSEPVVRDKVPSGKAVRTLGAKVMSEKWAQDPPVKKFVKDHSLKVRKPYDERLETMKILQKTCKKQLKTS